MVSWRVDRYVLDTLLRDIVGHDKRPLAYVVYLHLWSRTHAVGGKGVRASHQNIADETLLSRSAVQAAIRVLTRRRLLRSERPSRTGVPEHFPLRPWLRRG